MTRAALIGLGGFIGGVLFADWGAVAIGVLCGLVAGGMIGASLRVRW